MTEDEKKKIQDKLNLLENQFSRTTRRWKLAYRVFLILSALLSAGAAVILKLSFIGNEKLAGDISSIFAAAAAVSTTVVASLNFENFWRANQKAREEIRILILEADKPDVEAKKIIEDLQNIIRNRASHLLKED